MRSERGQERLRKPAFGCFTRHEAGTEATDEYGWNTGDSIRASSVFNPWLHWFSMFGTMRPPEWVSERDVLQHNATHFAFCHCFIFCRTSY